ncbi:MAG: MauE/DoxX family redox-associated membrane protein [Steroidobacteraceae bacterium]
MSVAHEVAGVLLAQIAAFLAVLLIASALHKAGGWRRTRSVVQDFAGVPRRAASAAALAVCAVEALAGALLMLPDHRRAGAVLASAILGVYLALIARAVALHRGVVDCGCSFGAGSRRLGTFEVVRNATLLTAALLLLTCTGAIAAIAPSQLLAACALFALYGAIDQMTALQPMRQGTVL